MTNSYGMRILALFSALVASSGLAAAQTPSDDAPPVKPTDRSILLEKYIGNHASQLAIGGMLARTEMSRVIFESQMAKATNEPGKLYDALKVQYVDTAAAARNGTDSLTNSIFAKLDDDAKRIEAIEITEAPSMNMIKNNTAPGFDQIADDAVGVATQLYSFAQDGYLIEAGSTLPASKVKADLSESILAAYVIGAQAKDAQKEAVMAALKSNADEVADITYREWVAETAELKRGTANDPVDPQNGPTHIVEIINLATKQRQLLQDGGKIALRMVSGAKPVSTGPASSGPSLSN